MAKMSMQEKVEKMAKQITEYVRTYKGVSFVELTKLFGDDAKGRWVIEEPKNCFWWTGMSKDFVDAVRLCLDRGEIRAKGTSAFIYYVDGKVPRFPVAKRPPKAGYKKPRWVPVIFDPVPYKSGAMKKCP